MGVYADYVFPRAMDIVMSTKQKRAVRARVCRSLSGEVFEIGFGTGLNLPHLPQTVTGLQAVDPLERGQKLARKRLVATAIPVEFVGLDGQCLPMEDASVDAALSTWTLCSVPDPAAAVREIARVLRPGGIFRFVEHGCSPDPNVRKWQRRLNPLQRRLACGCTLDRDIASIIEGAGMNLCELDTFYMKGEPKPFGWTFEGAARPT